MNRLQEIERELIHQHGRLIELSNLARVMGYQSVKAVKMADFRGSLPFKSFKIQGRRSKVVTTRAVAEWLARTETRGGNHD